MKNLFRALVCLLAAFTIQNSVSANVIDKTIFQSGINKSCISVSIKELDTGKVIYEQNSNRPTMPASTLKIVTLASSIDTLGKDYKFSTKLYKNTNNELLVKLGADPFLTSSDLKNMFSTAVKNKKVLAPKFIYIDDYILDSSEWGEGWQWDDDLNPLMPKFSSYNLDNNLLGIVITPTTQGAPANIFTTKFYPTTFMNLVTTDNTNNIKISRNNSISPDMITVEGTVNRQQTEYIPINHPKRYFILRLEDAINTSKMEYYGKFAQKKLPTTNIYLVAQIDHSLNDAINAILKNSNNFVAETVFKIAGGKFVNNTGSLANSQKMLNKYFEKLGLNYEDIKIVDGSGVSKNNLMTTDFMTSFLASKEVADTIQTALPTAGEGTLKNRMLYFKDNLRAKTGTLSDVSAIAGYITSRSGKTYVFDIMINDQKSKSSEKKSLEEYILRELYMNY
mgnify:FL=1